MEQKTGQHISLQDKLILERLTQAKQGGPFIAHEDVKAYFEAKARGEKPTIPQASIQKWPETPEQRLE
jgi:hypothetical protein